MNNGAGSVQKAARRDVVDTELAVLLDEPHRPFALERSAVRQSCAFAAAANRVKKIGACLIVLRLISMG